MKLVKPVVRREVKSGEAEEEEEAATMETGRAGGRDGVTKATWGSVIDGTASTVDPKAEMGS